MTAFLIFDLVIVVILALCVWRGAAKGFVLSLCGLVAVLIAFVGASFLAQTLAPKFSAAMEPRIAASIEQALGEQVDSALPTQPPERAPDDTDPLQGIWDTIIGSDMYQQLISSVKEGLEGGISNVASEVALSITTSLVQSIAYVVIFIVSFIIILLLWAILSRALDLVAHLPGLHFLNKTGGALVGLVEGTILLFVAAWAAKYLFDFIPQEALEHTYLLRFFFSLNPMSLLTGVA